MTTATRTARRPAVRPVTAARRRRFVCENCGAAAPARWIATMDAAGFSLYHLCCGECGQMAL